MQFDLNTFAAWSAIIQTVVTIVAFIVQIIDGASNQTRSGKIIIKLLMPTWLILSLTFPLTIGYFIAIRIATIIEGDITALVERTAFWAILLGLVWGVFWDRKVLPFLIRHTAHKKGSP